MTQTSDLQMSLPSRLPALVLQRLRQHRLHVALPFGIALCALGLAACASAPATPPATATPNLKLTPRAFIPAFQVGDTEAQQVTTDAPRVLFINGDHLPESGYPHSRVRDEGVYPESFSRLRAEVLEGDLGLGVDEFILTANNTIRPEQIAPYRLVVLGSNNRRLTPEEVQALTDYYNSGGRVLVYADFQYGPDNWASDNDFLAQFGVEVLPDNFQPATVITDIVTPHPIMEGVRAFGVEGASQFIVRAAVAERVTIIAQCSPLARSGCALQETEQARISPGDQVVCTWVREVPSGGKLAGTCDRNTFHNGPGPGSDLDQHDNRVYARNLFRWLIQ